MIELFFRNMESTEYARQLVLERMGEMLDRVPRLANHKFKVELERIDSGFGPEPDYFKVHVQVKGMLVRQMQLSSKHPSLYRALADICEELSQKVK